MKIIEKGERKVNVLSTIFNNRGITDVNKLLNVNEKNINLDALKNQLQEGVNLIKNNLYKKIRIIVDSDCDGITSGASIYKYLKAIDKNIDVQLYFHMGKRHGITNEFMNLVDEGLDFDLLIVPDAGTNDVENIEKLVTIYKKDVLIIDHHNILKKCDFGVIINNQINGVNKNLTGAGMVYVFCKELEKTYNTGVLKDIKNLTMLGQISDCSDLLEDDVRSICMSSLCFIENKFIRRMYENANKDVQALTFKDLSFRGIIPLLNAVMRVGEITEKQIVFRALVDENFAEPIIMQKKKLNKTTRKYELINVSMDIYDYALDICNKVVNRQNGNKTIKELEKQYNENLAIQVYIIENPSELDKETTGLMANKLAGKFECPSVVCWRNGDNLTGSLRGNESVLEDFSQWCRETNLFYLVQGHPNASGIGFKSENLDKLIEKIKNFKSVNERIFNVDYIYFDVPNENDIKLICNFSSLWNNGVEEPIFGFKGLKVSTNLIKWSKNTIRVYINGITLIKFGVPEEEYLKMQENDYITIDAVGKFNKNIYNEKITYQVIFDDLELVKEESKNFKYGLFA